MPTPVTPRVILITDPRYGRSLVAAVIRAAGRALGPGALAVQLRDKSASPSTLADVAASLREVTREVGALLLVNGAAEVAVSVRADGVHVPSNGDVAEARRVMGQQAFVTAAAHDGNDVRRAVADGASAVLVSPIFASPGKGTPRGTEVLAEARAHTDHVAAASGNARVLVYALGGVDENGAPLCAESGADGVAVIRSLLEPSTSGASTRSRGVAPHGIEELIPNDADVTAAALALGRPFLASPRP